MFRRLLLSAALLLLWPRLVLGQAPSATYTGSSLAVSIPYAALHAGSGRLLVEVLDPEDHILGRSERAVDEAQGHGAWQQQIRFDKPIPLDDLVWDRVRFRFDPAGTQADRLEGTRSIAQILRRPVVHLVAQQSYFAGGEAAVRVIVTDSGNQPLTGRTSIHIELTSEGHAPQLLFSGRLNSRGTAPVSFRFPADLTCPCQLHYTAQTAIGSAEYTQSIRLEDKASILLTTEKPIYQPGQTIHVRALALDRAGHHAVADRKLVFEVEDSRGNKVFKKITETDKFGIASAEFALADEVNLGTYHLRALMGEPGAMPTNTSEIALNVERYVLPKFRVQVDFPEVNKKPRRDYRPGDHVTGTIRASYFFGNPVDGAEIDIKASSLDVAVFNAASAHGKTGKDGTYHFDLKLPTYFAGRPLSQGAARVLVEATVKDSAGHAETRGEPITVSQSPLLVLAIPEAGTLIPHLDNEVFVLTSYPDGTPAATKVTAHPANGPEQTATTDASGVATIRLNGGTGSQTLSITADDRHGSRATTSISLDSRSGGDDQILLRADKAVYRAGDRIVLNILSTKQRGTAYLDIIQDGQTILTRDVDIDNGRAELTLTASPEMAGTLDFNAYLLGRDARAVADHRLAFVQPADELKIEAVADAPAYKPGAEARVRFHVTNSHGLGVSAALGIQVVDEAVFALAEKQPGFAKVFFYLEQEVMKPRYEIHSLSLDDAIDSSDTAEAAQRNTAARVLFAAAETTNANKLDTEFGRTIPDGKRAAYTQRYQAALSGQIRKLAAKYVVDEGGPAALNLTGDPAAIFAAIASETGSRPVDPWGNELRSEPFGWARPGARYYRIRSAGPDGQFNTADDLTLLIEDIGAHPADRLARGRIDIAVDHDLGPFNGRAEITGSVIDPSGAVIPGAAVRLRLAAGVNTRTTHTGRAGQFAFAAVTPGKYEIEITMPGFETASRELEIKPRDRATLTSRLHVGSEDTTVEVSAAAPMIAAPPKPILGLAGGMGGGVAMSRSIAINANQDMVSVDAGSNSASTVLSGKDLDGLSDDARTPAKSGHADGATHIRSYFPEALYINPEIVTDGNGLASITIPVADSITTWRMAMLASTESGALGSGTSSLKVFQDFFVDLDLPVTLTQGDRVTLPVAAYNYSGEAGDVTLKLEQDDWFSLVNDSSDKSLHVAAGQVGGAQYTLQANRIGKFKLTLSAQLQGGTKRQDIVVREIEVIPNGREQNLVYNGRLEADVNQEIKLPDHSIPDASTIFIRLYPGPLSQVIEGMDGILRMPGGCFEQTSSSTYPNVLALDYMKRTKKLTPEVHAKAEGYIANGYQRLLTFEVPGGGFSWFGSAPANKILTAYGLMEFSDMSKVYDVDPQLISRTSNWLASQQQPDGSWKPDTSFINEGATNRYNSDILRITAYLAWALQDSGYHGPAIEKAKRYIAEHLSGKADAYTLAVVANFAVEYAKDRDLTQRALQDLIEARTEKDDLAWWTADQTGVYSTGESAAVETTGLATQALLKWGQAAGTVRKTLAYLASKKSANGNWGTTQATIMALRALLLATDLSASDVHGAVEISLNGKVVQKLQLTTENNDLLHQFAFKGADIRDANAVQLRFDGSGGLAYQIVGRYFLPWDKQVQTEALAIDVAYDRTRMSQNDMATATATIRNNLDKTANMVMVDLGIPPGFELLSEDLQDLQDKSPAGRTGHLEKFSLTGTQAILYFNALAPKETVKIKFRLRAKFPIRAKTFLSQVYEYYDPAVNAVAPPVQLEVDKK